MKTKVILYFILIWTALSSCTPTSLSPSSASEAHPFYGTGGEHSSGPDNDKD
ncbi:hypothetical protein [Ulvibacter litoralis]|uniref:Lipoprotein n=1 Tax=Ulvibacter litoralis TaxID=227084 RepID=A0A1G7JFB6_9FLAO|nr:hypothetical protein [Ulvibacter litoralis]SDF23601.1 hypothetical protein SAMN05421855_1128 [Ulvibacter litoralis]